MSIVQRRDAYGVSNRPGHDVGSTAVGKVRKADGTEVEISVMLKQNEALESAIVQAMTENQKLRGQLLAAQAKAKPEAEISLDSRNAWRADEDPRAEMIARTHARGRAPLATPRVVIGPNGAFLRSDSAPSASAADDEDPAEAMRRRTYERGRKPLGGR